MVDIKLYTVAQIREWLEHNHPAEGLSEQVIAPTRAWAIIHNPYVKDDDAIVAAIFEDGQEAAYTASFPEMIEGKRIWWASTLYCDPKFVGRGYGLIVIGSLKEAHEPELTYDRWGAPETVEIFKHLDYSTVYTTRYRLSQKNINKKVWRGKLAYCLQTIKKWLHSSPKQFMIGYTLRYASYIDGEAYDFMKAHKGDNLWIREQDMLNWILRYPFFQGCTLAKKVNKDIVFTANVGLYEYKVVKIYTHGELCGVYLCRHSDSTLSIVYLYYSSASRDTVFASIVDHLISIKPNSFVTEDEDLLDFVSSRFYYPLIREEKISFSIPLGEEIKTHFSLQLGDGDSFA